MASDTIPRKTDEKNSVCFICCLLHEHDFLPQMIEHHVKCGISQFIFLIGNYGLKEPQPEFKIPEEYKDIVTLININRELIDGNHRKEFDNICVSNRANKTNRAWKLKPSDFCAAAFVQFYLARFGYNKDVIKTEWIMSIAVDQYLNITSGQQLPEWLGTLDKNCNQVFMPWGAEMFHAGFQMEDTFSGIMKQKGTIAYFPAFGTSLKPNLFTPTNSLCKTKAFKHLDGTTHMYITHPDPEATIHIVDTYHKADEIFKTGNPKFQVWPKMSKKIEQLSNGGTSIDKIPIYSIHFRLRGFTEMFVGNILWHFCKPDYNLKDPHVDPWNIYAKFIKEYLNGNNNGDLTNLFQKLSGAELGNRDDPRKKNLPPHVKEKTLIHSDNKNYPLKDITISKWDYKYKITTNHYDNLIWDELKKYNITKENLIDIFNINLKARDLPLITENIKNTSERIFFTKD